MKHFKKLNLSTYLIGRGTYNDQKYRRLRLKKVYICYGKNEGEKKSRTRHNDIFELRYQSIIDQK
ncbi:hypothetical protein BLOT_011225 [Blomia tropicalis]|nr:hypothetical protein BLOT_011225 [Blomia tropicalis]